MIIISVIGLRRYGDGKDVDEISLVIIKIK
jgi:hypothetical protein